MFNNTLSHIYFSMMPVAVVARIAVVVVGREMMMMLLFLL
jgi:hypothetical protein